MCRCNHIFSIETLISNSETLTEYRKDLLRFRYIRLLREFRNRCRFYSVVFNACRIIVTIGSLLVPALLAVQYSKDSVFATNLNIEIPIYWTTWGISLLVTIANGIFTLFKIDKKYFFLHTIYEKLQSEGYQYLQLTGRYSGLLNKNKRNPTHSNQFVYFCHNIEKIKLMQVYDEYFKLSETKTTKEPSGNNQLPVSIPAPSRQPPIRYYDNEQDYERVSNASGPEGNLRPMLRENINLNIGRPRSNQGSVVESDGESDKTSIDTAYYQSP